VCGVMRPTHRSMYITPRRHWRKKPKSKQSKPKIRICRHLREILYTALSVDELSHRLMKYLSDGRDQLYIFFAAPLHRQLTTLRWFLLFRFSVSLFMVILLLFYFLLFISSSFFFCYVYFLFYFMLVSLLFFIFILNNVPVDLKVIYTVQKNVHIFLNRLTGSKKYLHIFK
jgi:hypothetical protein